MKRLIAIPVVLFVLIGLMISACSESKEAKIARHLQQGGKYFSEAKYKEAVIEYQNVLKLDPENAKATAQLGLAAFETGQIELAIKNLFAAEKLDPENLAVRHRLGSLYLLGKKSSDARVEAEYILAKTPNDIDALSLLAGASAVPQDIEDAIKRLESVQSEFGNLARYHLTLGNLYERQGNRVKAESEFKKAIECDSKSPEARTIIGHFYLADGNVEEAEKELRTAANLAPTSGPVQLDLADFYLTTGKPEDAKTILQRITEKEPGFLDGWYRRAEIAFNEGHFDESLAMLDHIFKTNPGHIESNLLKGRIYLAQRQTDAAIEEFRELVKLYPTLPQARYYLAMGYLKADKLLDAKAELKEATNIAPDYIVAQLSLAEIDLRENNPESAIETLEKLVQKHQDITRAYELLGTAYMSQDQYVKAEESVKNILNINPENPGGYYLLGLTLLAQGKQAEALTQFEQAIKKSPTYFQSVMEQIVSVQLAAGKSDEAIERIKKQLDSTPEESGLHYLLGKVYQSKDELKKAEAEYLKAIELNPQAPEAYITLSQIYAAAGEDDAALAKVSELLKQNSNNTSALLIAGIIQQRKGDIAKAKESYEKVLLIDPTSALAANNLANIYLNHDKDQDKAFQLARQANQEDPEQPAYLDTLGWILYQRGDYKWAASLLSQSAAKVPENSTVLYHLGMAQYQLKDMEAARKSLNKVLEIDPKFPQREQVREVLNKIK